MKFQIINFIILNLLLTTSCLKFYKQQTITEPINIAIIDKSRVDNLKIRHIFAAFLLKGIINKGEYRINVFVSDSSNIDTIDYEIDFDIMDYGADDIEKGTIKLLVSAKIVKMSSQMIISSHVESATGKNPDYLCLIAADKLSSALVNKLNTFHKYKAIERFPEPDSLD